MFNTVRRHLHRVNNLRELRSLDSRLRADIGLGAETDGPAREIPLLLLPLGPADHTRR